MGDEHGPAGASNAANIDLDYTSLRLRHATPEHIHLTTRRCFIGPIPEGWLNTHRKAWYKNIVAKNYSSRAATFHAAGDTSHERQASGLNGPSASAAFAASFPQPEDVDEDEADAGVPLISLDGEVDETELTEARNLTELRAQATHEPQADANDEIQTAPAAHSSLHVPLASLLKPIQATKKKPSFVTAPVRQAAASVRSAAVPHSQSDAAAPSFHTAAETLSSATKPVETDNDGNKKTDSSANSSPNLLEQSTSRSALLPKPAGLAMPKPEQSEPNAKAAPQRDAPGLVRFATENQQVQPREAQNDGAADTTRSRSWNRLLKNKNEPGEIVKVEKMLVKVDSTAQSLPDNYSENDSLRVEGQAVDKWREFIVVCRKGSSDEADFCIQLYKTRVIPARTETRVSRRSTHEIPLDPRKAHVNLYSTLDKTLVIWVPWPKRTVVFILRARSAASAVEWYTFTRQCLGWHRLPTLQIYVPDLSVSLKLKNPFRELERSIAQAKRTNTENAALATMEAEKAASYSIIEQCLSTLNGNPAWADVVKYWKESKRVGLAWKRYDRLEWVHGANEQRMYGTLAMQRTHELELRPKEHYPTAVKDHSKTLTEPAPVEGFLIRLTSQKGRVRRMGKMYFKRLYYYTHNQYLCYCRPAQAVPPAPPRHALELGTDVPAAEHIIDKTPLIFEVDPFPRKNGSFEWLTGSNEQKSRRSREACLESERKIATLLQADGYINLVHVVRVRDLRKSDGAPETSTGPDVDFHQEVDNTSPSRSDGRTEAVDDDRIFELVMDNGLVIRLQAYDIQTKREWISRLQQLVQYWKLRLADDMTLLKSIRSQNLKNLEIDEEMESWIGQFAEKWEVTRSVASAELHNMCGISCCRAITMAGTLYRKPKRHAMYNKCSVILCHGKLLVFRGSLRQCSGKEVRHVQHDRQAVIDLQNCYIYSGFITEGDQLYEDETFDGQNPGHYALPRVYLEDGWTSTDEDSMTTFVVWQPRNKSWFRAAEGELEESFRPTSSFRPDKGGRGSKTRQTLRYVSRLGVPGRTIVFKARSRAERDHWVMSISMEIDRVHGSSTEDIRVVHTEKLAS